ncbi:flagellar hook capping FlgD N-terminal domain-containing protein [Arthrobacter antibioticus]|uniref:flagellar hook capping FlgD N-terminal domain-containing protein n=1 Tax=Arthrobacter sp. H35-MC1 TaxID=3046203 RepID=UPI0024B97A0A|nr:flagellar hook capping FlgD N-terminal domain-containing protein [Arthrobacter sp. H35-MC1]MDJ0316651.1 flagellar hook capping FlgD N-terminal domain-containing protein [Arthrobacter sp. H35-MC1]
MSEYSIAPLTPSGNSMQPPTAVDGINNIPGRRDPKQVMDSEVFMNLLVAQLRHQDPSSPMDTNEMISQTTQLATMEKLTNMDKTATESFSLQMRTAAAALIGEQVSWQDADGTAHSGIASSVSFINAVPQVSVGGKMIPLDHISGITSTGKPEPVSI